MEINIYHNFRHLVKYFLILYYYMVIIQNVLLRIAKGVNHNTTGESENKWLLQSEYQEEFSLNPQLFLKLWITQAASRISYPFFAFLFISLIFLWGRCCHNTYIRQWLQSSGTVTESHLSYAWIWKYSLFRTCTLVNLYLFQNALSILHGWIPCTARIYAKCQVLI